MPTAMLTQDDVQRLLSEPTWHVRQEVAEKVSSRYALGQFEGRQIAIAEQIFRLLMKDTEVQVRKVLAEQLKESESIPRDVLLSMARDVSEVAVPVLEVSDLLSDADLISIVESGKEIERMVAIAKRKKVSLRVSKALVDTGKEDVVVNLVRNEGAEIPEQSFDKILQDFAGHTDIVSSVVERAHLPVTVIEKLIALVSDKVADELTKKYNISATRIMLESENTREMATLKLIDHNTSQADVEQLVTQLKAFHRLTPSIILSGLCRGNFRFFETSLARLSNIPVANAHMLINDKGELGFRALYEKAGLPESMFMAVKMALIATQQLQEDGTKPGTMQYANRVVDRILEFARDKEVDNLSYIIALIRQNSSGDKRL